MNRILKIKNMLQPSPGPLRTWCARLVIACLMLGGVSAASGQNGYQGGGDFQSTYPATQSNGFSTQPSQPINAPLPFPTQTQTPPPAPSGGWNWPTQAQGLATPPPASSTSVDPVNYELEFADADIAAQPMGDVERLTTTIKQAGSDIKQKISGWISDDPAAEGASITSLKNQSWFKRLSGLFKGDQLGKTLGSLAVVIGGYFGLVWLSRKFNPGSLGGLPSEVVEVMGRTPFGPQQNLQLVRLGSKLLLLLNGPDGTHPIGEVSDPSEVEYLASLCPGKKHLARPANADSSAVAAIERAAQTLVPRRRETAESPGTSHADRGDLQDVISQLKNVLNRDRGLDRSRNSFEA